MAQQSTFDEESKQNDTATESTSVVKFPVRVFVRLRPLIQSELEAKHEELEYNTASAGTTIKITDITKKTSRQSIKPKGAKTKDSKKAIKKFKGFERIFSAKDDNVECFEQCVLPSMDNIFKGFTVCSFAYGHTGSGKTHTILGYDEKSPGLYAQTLAAICAQIDTLNDGIKDKEEQILVSCQFAELYQGKMRDLFGDLVECHVREDDEGNINIRGPTIKDETSGEVIVQPLTPVYVSSDSIGALIKRVKHSLTLRKQGSSAVHDESSRSHVFLTMELVTNKLVAARQDLQKADGKLTAKGFIRDEMLIIQQTKQYSMDSRDNKEYKWEKNVEYEGYLEDQATLDVIQSAFDECEKEYEECEQRIRDIVGGGHVCIGGTVVFVDLAGNEWGSDSKHIKNDNSVQKRERNEINKSLLSLKECVRALHDGKKHVPFRNSKLTMVLKPHLKGMNSTAIMIANISPSQQHIKKSFNTLSYSQLVANA